MKAIGMVMVFAGYSLGITAYGWIKGYNMTLGGLFHSTWGGKTASKPVNAATSQASQNAQSQTTSTSAAAGGIFPTPTGQPVPGTLPGR